MNLRIRRYLNIRRGRPLFWLLVTLLLIAAIYYGEMVISARAEAPTRLIVYAFSTQEEVMTQGIFPAFKELWETQTGREIEIQAVFGPSGTLAGQIILGAPADIAIFSNERHADLLKYSGLVRQKKSPQAIGSTPMVILTRPGNPFNLSAFSDLAQPGLRLIHANPRTSGAGEWAVLAEYGTALLAGGDEIEAERQLKDIWSNVRLLGSSARASLKIFELGAGDALVTYEQDALLARQLDQAFEIILPESTILAQHFAVIVNDNVTVSERSVTEAFMQFLKSQEGQEIYSRYYWQADDLTTDRGGQEKTQFFTAYDLGGWSDAHQRIIVQLWSTEIEPHLNLAQDPTNLVTGE